MRKDTNKNFCIIIPAYNEEACINTVIEELFSTGIKNKDIVIIDDGSKDKTFFKANKKKVTIIKLSRNYGVGKALQFGFNHALKKGYDYAIQMDADAQHDPQDIKTFVENYNKSKVDFIIGSRFLNENNYKTPLIRLLCIKILAISIRMCLSKKITDPTSGYRLFGKSALKLFSKNYPQSYPETKSIIIAHFHDLKILEIGVHMRKRIAGKSSLSIQSGFFVFLSNLKALFEIKIKSFSK